MYGDGVEDACELDVVSCRSFAILKAERLLVADFPDRVEVYTPAGLTTMDFVFIDE